MSPSADDELVLMLQNMWYSVSSICLMQWLVLMRWLNSSGALRRSLNSRFCLRFDCLRIDLPWIQRRSKAFKVSVFKGVQGVQRRSIVCLPLIRFALESICHRC